GAILPAELLAIPPKGAVGIHPSLLPRHRGASPIQGAILAGDAETGVTLYLLDAEMDHGPVLGQETLVLNGEGTYRELEEALAVVGAKLALTLLPRYLAGELSPAPQDHAQATFTRKFKTEDGFVELGKDEPEVIARKIRALNPEPGVWAIVPDGRLPAGRQGKRLKLLAVERRPEGLVATRIQWEGKTPHDAALPLN
ncbi:MAG: methionyl-tRNA formyltransferase, partial [Candidatus Liptonbacteria bacterium]|nr:methionyl-tRNA formyltransferase [Candidatus Liptonbacteria bacterium]